MHWSFNRAKRSTCNVVIEGTGNIKRTPQRKLPVMLFSELILPWLTIICIVLLAKRLTLLVFPHPLNVLLSCENLNCSTNKSTQHFTKFIFQEKLYTDLTTFWQIRKNQKNLFRYLTDLQITITRLRQNGLLYRVCIFILRSKKKSVFARRTILVKQIKTTTFWGEHNSTTLDNET